MPDIAKELTIATDPGRVFDALTQQDDIALWWTDDLSVKPEVGSLAEFRFRQGTFILQFEVAELDAGEKVYWILRQAPEPWPGTSVTWQLTPVQNGTKLFFTHDGFTQPHEEINRTWDYFLASLKSYLETGKGTPNLPVAA